MPVPVPMPGLDCGRFSTVAVGYSISNVSVHRVSIHHASNMRLKLHKLRERGYQFLKESSWCLGMQGASGVVAMKAAVLFVGKAWQR